jgi:hypothetical protein
MSDRKESLIYHFRSQKVKVAEACLGEHFSGVW